MVMRTRLWLIITTLLIVSGCASSPSPSPTALSLLHLALSRSGGITLTQEEVQNTPVDLLYVQLGDLPRAVLALAFLEEGEFKWISQDQAMLVTEQGRIVRTLGLKEDLLYLSNTKNDPLRLPVSQRSGAHWVRRSDWQVGAQSGYRIHSRFETEGEALLEIFGRSIPVQLQRERVRFMDTGEEFENLFWSDPVSGMLLRSRQQLSPHTPVMELTHLSAIVRLIAYKEGI